MANNISIEGARIMFRNFSGKADKYNPAGRRTFCVILSDEMAEDLSLNGWNVKYLQPKSDEDSPLPYLSVKVNYANIPPKIYMVTKRNKTLLDENSVCALDYAEIDNVDIVITGSNYDVNGKTGISAYVKNMYVTIIEDEFADKYNFDGE